MISDLDRDEIGAIIREELHSLLIELQPKLPSGDLDELTIKTAITIPKGLVKRLKARGGSLSAHVTLAVRAYLEMTK